MPQRPNAHVIGARAAAAVAVVVADAGFAVETVSNDYGEDLLVQTAHLGKMDANRLWIQVKGTTSLDSYRRRDGSLQYRFSYGHISRWLQSSDPVVVVLWDVTSGLGYFAWPMSQLSAWKASLAGESRAVLTFDGQFNKEAMKNLAWVGRIYHYWRLLQMAVAHDEEVQETLPDPQTQYESLPFGALRTHVILDFLSIIGVAETEMGRARLNPEARGRLAGLITASLYPADGERIEIDDIAQLVVTLGAILVEEYTERAAGIRLEDPHLLVPSHLLRAGGQVVKALLFPHGMSEFEALVPNDAHAAENPGSATASIISAPLGGLELAKIFESHGVSRVSAVATDLQPGLVLLVHDPIDEGLTRYIADALEPLIGAPVTVSTQEELWSAAQLTPLRDITSYTFPRSMETPKGEITLAAISLIFEVHGFDRVWLVAANSAPHIIFLIDGESGPAPSLRVTMERELENRIGVEVVIETRSTKWDGPLIPLRG